MNFSRYRWWMPYGVAIATTAIALLLTLWLDPLLDSTVIAFFYLAIVVTAWYGGIQPGAIAVILSILAIDYFFTPPLYEFSLMNPSNWIRFSIFIAIACIINLLSGNLRDSQRRVKQLHQQLQEENNQSLRMALASARMGLWDWNIVTGKIIWSPEHETLLGLAPGTFDGRYETFAERVHPDDLQMLSQVVQQALQERKIYQHEYRIIRTDGSVHWVEGRGQGFYDEAGQAIRMAGTIMDIDGRKAAEESLRLSEERYRSLVEATTHSVWVVDAQGNICSVPSSWTEITGQVLEIGTAWDWLEVVHPDDRVRVRQTFSHCLATGELYDIEYRVLSANGEYRLFLVKAVPVYDANRNIREWIGTLSDVTEHRRAEAEIRQLNVELEQRVAERTTELQRSNELLSSFFNAATSANIGLAIHDQAFRFVQINGALAAINGQPIEAHLGKVVDEILPDLALTIKPLLSQVLMTGQPILNLEIASEVPSLPGVVRYWLASYFPMLQTEREVKAVGVIVVEISDRKQAEAVQSQLAAIIESSNDAILSKTLNGIVISWNNSAERLFGYSAEEIVGRSITQIIPEEYLEEEVEVIKKITSGERIQHYETVRQHKNGTIIDVALTLSPVKDHSGQTIGISTIVRDITEQRQLDRMKSEFISIVSHELRTPLTAIRGSLGLVMAGVYNQKPERKRRMIEIAAQQSDRLVRLVNDILDLQRLESGSMKLTMQSCDVGDLIQQSVETMRSSADEQQIKIIATSSSQRVWASPDAVIQTLTNLLSNAIKFSEPNHTIRVSVEENYRKAQNDQARNHLLTAPAQVLVAVKDQGRGIPTDKLETIFERFHQVDASDSREKGGTGLGLAICRKIIEQHGGKIWVESVLGEGSTFYFTLPLAKERS